MLSPEELAHVKRRGKPWSRNQLALLMETKHLEPKKSDDLSLKRPRAGNAPKRMSSTCVPRALWFPLASLSHSLPSTE